VAVEATHATVVRATVASSQEAIVAWESAAALAMEVDNQATLAERLARERLSRMEAGSATTLASACRVAEGFARRISLLKGKLAEVHQARDMAEVNSQGLSNMAVDIKRQREESERECSEWV
jgi:hypothetical protein